MICDSVRIYWPAISRTEQQALVYALELAIDALWKPTNKPWVRFVHPSHPAAYMYYLAQHHTCVPNQYMYHQKPFGELELACFSSPNNRDLFAETAAGSLFMKTAEPPRQTLFAMHPSQPGAQYHTGELVDIVVATGLFTNLRMLKEELCRCRSHAGRAGTPLVIVLPQYQASITDNEADNRLREGLFRAQPLDEMRWKLRTILRDIWSIESVPSGLEMQSGIGSVSELILRHESLSTGWFYKQAVSITFFETGVDCKSWYKYWLYVNACQAFADERRPLSPIQHQLVAAAVTEVVHGYAKSLPMGEITYVYHVLTAID